METTTSDGILHGTVTGYTKHGCRKPCCRDAWAAYQRNYTRRKSLHGKKTTKRESGMYFRGQRYGARVRLTALGLGIAEAAAQRTGKPLDDVVDAALRCCGSRIEFPQ